MSTLLFVSMTGHQIRTFRMLVQCMAKIGSRLLLKATSHELILRAVDDTTTAFFSASLDPKFFDEYQIGNAEPVLGAVLLKHVLSSLRSQKIEQYNLQLEQDGTQMTATILTESGLKKVYTMVCCDGEFVDVREERDKGSYPAVIQVAPKDMTRLLSTFQANLEELIWIVRPLGDDSAASGFRACQLQSFHDGLTTKANDTPMFTSVAVDTQSTFQTYVNNNSEPTDVTFNVKHCRVMIAVCDHLQAYMNLWLDQPGQPVILEPNETNPHHALVKVRLLLATLPDSQLAAAAELPTFDNALGAARLPTTATNTQQQQQHYTQQQQYQQQQQQPHMQPPQQHQQAWQQQPANGNTSQGYDPQQQVPAYPAHMQPSQDLGQHAWQAAPGPVPSPMQQAQPTWRNTHAGLGAAPPPAQTGPQQPAPVYQAPPAMQNNVLDQQAAWQQHQHQQGIQQHHQGLGGSPMQDGLLGGIVAAQRGPSANAASGYQQFASGSGRQSGTGPRAMPSALYQSGYGVQPHVTGSVHAATGSEAGSFGSGHDSRPGAQAIHSSKVHPIQPGLPSPGDPYVQLGHAEAPSKFQQCTQGGGGGADIYNQPQDPGLAPIPHQATGVPMASRHSIPNVLGHVPVTSPYAVPARQPDDPVTSLTDVPVTSPYAVPAGQPDHGIMYDQFMNGEVEILEGTLNADKDEEEEGQRPDWEQHADEGQPLAGTDCEEEDFDPSA